MKLLELSVLNSDGVWFIDEDILDG